MSDRLYIDLLNGVNGNSGVHQWVSSDDEERWNENQKNPKSKAKLEKLGWTPDSFEYHCDSLGFRNNKDLEKNVPYTLFLGCSHTFGIGLPIECVWTSIVTKFLQKPTYNAARAGAGIDSCYRILKYLINQDYKFENLFLFSPHPGRIEIWDEFEKKWMVATWWSHYPKDLLSYLNHQYFTQINFDKTLDAIENLCVKNKINLVHMNTDSCDDLIIDDCKARDLMHAGKDAHEKIAYRFIDIYNRQSLLNK